MSDRLPICEMCRNFPGEYKFCPITARCCRDDFLCDSCSDFEQKGNPTLFDQITASYETLAKKLVYWVYDEDYGKCGWTSNLMEEYLDKDYEKAFAATVAKLKEVTKDDR